MSPRGCGGASYLLEHRRRGCSGCSRSRGNRCSHPMAPTPWLQRWLHSPPYKSVHAPRTPPAESRSERPRSHPDPRTNIWKACWGQPLTSSNLVSSAQPHRAERRPRPGNRPGPSSSAPQDEGRRAGSLLEQRAPVSDLNAYVAAAIARRHLARPPAGREPASNRWQLMARACRGALQVSPAPHQARAGRNAAGAEAVRRRLDHLAHDCTRGGRSSTPERTAAGRWPFRAPGTPRVRPHARRRSAADSSVAAPRRHRNRAPRTECDGRPAHDL